MKARAQARAPRVKENARPPPVLPPKKDRVREFFFVQPRLTLEREMHTNMKNGMRRRMLEELFTCEKSLGRWTPRDIRMHGYTMKLSMAMSSLCPAKSWTIIAEQRMNGMFFRVMVQSVLTHEEHDRMVLEPGFYLKVDQVEFDPFDEVVRAVLD